ncbi:Hypothetical predicted protein [Mytilus galloprovincialis]|uniref:Fibronectin type-III domain-containing protein n=1 Tax=Mytilus galloprovincialis TaxID=29158 RepID=A0A8B6DRK9_MYTGA|nr:Hypothetical predicted protein [Mytilus galloprovincialis]
MCETVNDNTYNYCVKDLKEGQSYNFKVTAINRCGPGSSLESLQPIKLLAKPSAPSGPLSISNITDSSAFIEWQAPQNDGGAQVEEYHLEYQLVDETTWIMCKTVNDNTYNYCVKDLKEGQSYNFKVTAINRCGPGSSLESLQPIKLLAKPSAPSGPLSISNITDSSAFIEWQAPQNDGGALVEEYHLEYQLVDETTWIMCETVNDNTYNYCVKDLKEGQSYNFKVTASNRCGPGSSLESLQPTKLLA